VRYPCPGYPQSFQTTSVSTRFPGKTVFGSQYTDSEEHQWHSRKEAALSDVGGNFFTQKRHATVLPVNVSRTTDGILALPVCQRIRSTAPVHVLNPTLLGFPPSMHSTTAQLEKLGAEAVARCKPTNSVADLGVFLGEIMQGGLPRVAKIPWRTTKDFERSVRNPKNRPWLRRKTGSEYLNVEFGWRPFLDELGQLAIALEHAEGVIRQYERDAGKPVRRKYSFPLSTSTETTLYSTGFYWSDPAGVASSLGFSGDQGVLRTREFEQRRWFSGAFTYHLPSGYDSRIKMNEIRLQADKLLGLELSPELVWNLTPWSWAVDWVSNAGDVISNVSDSMVDGLVMRYGYLMEHTIVKDTYTRRSPKVSGGRTISPSATFITETKQRVRANPFGFGLNWDGLSPRQLAILGALGISRR